MEKHFINKDGKNHLEIPLLKSLRHEYGVYLMDKHNATQKAVYFKCLLEFYYSYCEYCNTIISKHKLTQHQIACHIFGTGKSDAHIKLYLLSCIYISRDYVEYLLSKITEGKLHVYDTTLSALDIDLESLILRVEVHYKRSIDSLTGTSWRRRILSPTDIYAAAQSIFYIEEYNRIEDLYLRDIKPVVMFQIRQLLEVFSRNVIGYFDITDSKDEPIKKLTHIAWDFLKLEISKENPRIEFPFDIHIVIKINQWANSFVHTTYLYSDYIQFFALELIKGIFKPAIEAVSTFNEKRTISFDHADIRIKDYNSLKTDFENFIATKSQASGAVVNWKEVDKVGAYIVSL